MKKLYLACVSLFFILSVSSNAQMITAPHATLDYSGPSTNYLVGEFDVMNSSNQNLEILVESYNRNLQPGHYTYFCWYVCYDTLVTASPYNDFISLAPGASTSNFHSYIVPNSPGHDDICYRFFDRNGLSDT